MINSRSKNRKIFKGLVTEILNILSDKGQDASSYEKRMFLSRLPNEVRQSVIKKSSSSFKGVVSTAIFSMRQLSDRVIRGSKIKAQYERDIDIHSHGSSIANRKADRKRKRVLILGPTGFREGVWQTRVKYIFPDLFDPLHQDADIFMLTGPVPAFARAGINSLSQKYDISFKEVDECGDGLSRYQYWINEALHYSRAVQPDVITNIFSPVLFSYVAAYVANAIGIRSVVRVAGDEIRTRLALGKYECGGRSHKRDLRKESFGMNLSDAVIAMSVPEQQRLQDICIDENKVEVCVRGVDTQVFHPSSAATDRPVRKFLFIGRKSLEKGYDIAEGAALLLEKMEPDVRFIFAGTFDKNIVANREYIGFVESEQLPALYNSVDAVILCSRSEGFPQVLMEAMAMAKPCIVSRDLFSNIFENGEQVVFTKLNSDSLAEKVVDLYSDSELSKKLSDNARKYAEDNFDKEKWEKIYKDIILGCDTNVC